MKVRANAVYTFHPVMMDVIWSQHHSAVDGQLVRVINLNGAPRANTMGQCHIESTDDRTFLGMVSTHSLVKE